MIDTEINAGTACAHCRKLGHWCRAVIAMDAIPYCLSCYDELPCEAQIAHKIRITGLGGSEENNLSGPVKSMSVSGALPVRDEEFKSDWRREFERRSAESVPKAKLSVTAKAARKARPHKKSPKPARLCPCGRKMKAHNKKGTCDLCSQKLRYDRTCGTPRPKCQHPGCLEVLYRSNRMGLCRWHNPNNMFRAQYKNSQPKMMEAA